MRLLLDTNAVLRWSDDRLAAPARRAVEEADEVVVSVVSLWEIAIKRFTGKLRFRRDIESFVEDYGFSALNLNPPHVRRFLELPMYHADYFDRMLIAQALEEGLTIVTSDRAFELYRVPLIRA